MTDWSLTAGSSTWNKLFDRYYRKKEVLHSCFGSYAWNDSAISLFVHHACSVSHNTYFFHSDRRSTQCPGRTLTSTRWSAQAPASAAPLVRNEQKKSKCIIVPHLFFFCVEGAAHAASSTLAHVFTNSFSCSAD
jgi:hypothetical protein